MAIVKEDRLFGLDVIDCDAHFTEPPDLWTARAPAKYRDRVPTLKTVDGFTGWYLNDEFWCSPGGNTIAKGRQKTLGTPMVQPWDEIDEASYDWEARLDIMDEMGVHTQVLYPNGMGFDGNTIMSVEDPAFRLMLLQTLNDFYIEIQEGSHERLLPQPLLPIWDMDLTVKEIDRLVGRGIRGFTIPDKTEGYGLPELPDPYWAPMWDSFNQSQSVVNFHIAHGARKPVKLTFKEMQARRMADAKKSGTYASSWQMFGPQRSASINATMFFISNIRILNNLCMSDMFDRYPNLKVVSAESGMGWVPFILESLEWQLNEFVTDPAEQSLQKRRPTDYFRDHFYVTFWFERVGPSKLIEDVGVKNVLIETDIPHPTCLYPGAMEHFASVLKDVDPYVRQRVLQDNAAELFRINL